jgi:hypothetical protein
VDQLCPLSTLSKDPVGAYLAAPPAVDTPVRIIFEGIFEI